MNDFFLIFMVNADNVLLLVYQVILIVVQPLGKWKIILNIFIFSFRE